LGCYRRPHEPLAAADGHGKGYGSGPDDRHDVALCEGWRLGKIGPSKSRQLSMINLEFSHFFPPLRINKPSKFTTGKKISVHRRPFF
jgi:hypothetical protein